MNTPDPSPPRDSLSERLAHLFGPGVDPGISLAPTDEGANACELVEELLRAGSEAERYEVRGEIDRGGMGVVLDVWDRELRRPLAMKVALDAQGGDGHEAPARRRLVRFLEEAQITGQLDHPGIVPVHELGIDAQQRVYFTMRRVRGRDLREIFHCVQFGLDGWTVTRALSVLLRVCETLAFAHSRGVLHRDIKPANVMVGAFGEVYVMDWGLARVIGRQGPAARAQESVDTVLRDERRRAPRSPLITSDGDVLGTPAYMAPEQARGESEESTARCDVYSLGALLYHLFAYEAPYSTSNERAPASAVLDALRQGPPRALEELQPDLAPELATITEKAMAYDPAHRYAGVDELAHDLRAWLEGRVVRAHEQGAWAEARKWVLRNRALAAALGAVLLALFVGFVGTRSQFLRAEERAREAQTNASIASAQTEQVLRLSDLQRLAALLEQSDALWPAVPSREADLRSWLARADALLAGLPAHRDTLSVLRVRALPGEEANTETFEFEDVELQWQHDLLAELVAGLERLAEPDPARSARADVLRRHEFASTLAARSTQGEAAALSWSTAIASVSADARYGDLQLEPQVGLLPLGPDPASGLWEFAHLASGEPARRGRDGRLVLAEATGVVLVLIPPGRFLMGAQSEDPAAPGYDPFAKDDESPPRHVEVAAFFLSKYELTQAQWMRATGETPSVFGPHHYEFDWSRDGGPASLLHPVERISWNDCARVLPRLDLWMPSEAEWEYAARAGTTSVWWTGDEVASLRGAANVADAFAGRNEATYPSVERELDDGYACHAPVGSFSANAFGLHDVVGNIIEWCGDGDPLDLEGPGDSERQDSAYSRRGGGWVLTAAYARSACRHRGVASFQSQSLGVRPAREVR